MYVLKHTKVCRFAGQTVLEIFIQLTSSQRLITYPVAFRVSLKNLSNWWFGQYLGNSKLDHFSYLWDVYEGCHEWTQIEYNISGCRTAWAPLWWWPCFVAKIARVLIVSPISCLFISRLYRRMTWSRMSYRPISWSLYTVLEMVSVWRRFSTTKVISAGV